MKRIALVLLMLVIIATAAITTACNNSVDKNAPVYTGMTVSGEGVVGESTISTSSAVGNGEQSGNNKTITVLSGTRDGVDYYAQAEQTVVITVHLSNPNAYEILSFTLNGYKYQSYEFERGSNSTELLLEVEMPAQRGIHDYTIDAIKYVMGQAVKDVKMDGNQTVRIAASLFAPVLTQTNSQINAFDATFGFTISDPDSVIKANTLKASLYISGVLVEERELMLSSSSISFSSLSYQTYDLIISAEYDLIDFNRLVRAQLLNITFKTHPLFVIEEVRASAGSVSYGIRQNFIGQYNAHIKAIEILNGSIVVASAASVQARVIEGLSPNTIYIIKLTYGYTIGVTDGEQAIAAAFSTLVFLEPTIQITDMIIGQQGASFELNIEDEEGIGTISSIKIMRGSTIVQEIDSQAREFSGLLPNTGYTLIVEYSYVFEGEQKTVNASRQFITYSDVWLSNVDVGTSAPKGGFADVFITIGSIESLIIDKIVINSQQYNVNMVSAATFSVRLDIPIDAGSELFFNIESILARNTLGTSYNLAVYYPFSILTGNPPRLQTVRFMNVLQNYVYHVILGEEYIAELFFNNESSYEITSIETNFGIFSSSLFVNASGNLCAPFIAQATIVNALEFNVISFSYLDENGLEISRRIDSFYFMPVAGTIYNVRTAGDFANMNANNIYELCNDIDFTGFNPTGLYFNGILRGNGYTLKNLTINATTSSAPIYDCGIFMNGAGSAENLIIDNFNFTINIVNQVADVRVGLFSARLGDFNATGISFTNCSITIQIANGLDLSSARIRAGSLCGVGIRVPTANCQSDANIAIVAQSTFGASFIAVGGIIGSTGGGQILIQDCAFAGSIKIGIISGDQMTQGLGNAGGIVGSNSRGSSTSSSNAIRSSYLYDCVNSGDIYAEIAGGIYGLMEASDSRLDFLVSNSQNSGTIYGEMVAGGIVGHTTDGVAEVTGCTNSGAINSKTYAAGIMGKFTNTFYEYKLIINSCQNNGQIGTSATQYAAGVIAYILKGDINDCVNNALIVGQTTDETAAQKIEQVIIANSSPQS